MQGDQTLEHTYFWNKNMIRSGKNISKNVKLGKGESEVCSAVGRGKAGAWSGQERVREEGKQIVLSERNWGRSDAATDFVVCFVFTPQCDLCLV